MDWHVAHVDLDQVGAKVARGAPDLWAHVRDLTRTFFKG